MSVSLVIAAGGTGGHLVPGLAIASAVRTMEPAARVTFVGTARGMEATLVPAAGYDVRTTVVRPFGTSASGLAGAAFVLPAVLQAGRILRDADAAVVIGMGGYASVPAVIAARMRGVPSLIHEANAIPGLGNQIAARFTRNIAVAFGSAARAFRHPAVVTGMPVRAEIAHLDRPALRDQALDAFQLDPRRTTVLVIGGSLGAVRIDRAVAGLARAWSDRSDVQILIATGHGNEAELAGAGPPLCRVVPFIDRMDLAYAAADVVVARAGASSIAEIAAAGLPAVLVPWPHARRREQHANAASLTEVGAAVVLDDAGLDAVRLAEVLGPLLAEPERRALMGKAARDVARTDAAEQIARWALRLAGERP